jgi:hypothetical protein
MDISKFVTELTSVPALRDTVAVKSFAIGFYGRYIVEINENNIVLIRRKTDEQLLEEKAKKIHCQIKFDENDRTFSNRVLKNGNLVKNDKPSPFYFTNTEDILYFDLTQCADKTVEIIIEENEVVKYADELKPIITGILEAYKRIDFK